MKDMAKAMGYLCNLVAPATAGGMLEFRLSPLLKRLGKHERQADGGAHELSFKHSQSSRARFAALPATLRSLLERQKVFYQTTMSGQILMHTQQHSVLRRLWALCLSRELQAPK